MSQTRHQPTSGGTQSRVQSLSPQRASISGTLRLRAEDTPAATNNRDDADSGAGPSRRIRWSEDVVDNEGMGKKSSKVCCIYHKPRPIGESSSEESSDSSSSDSDSDSDSCGGNRPQKDTSAQPASRGRSTCSHDHRKGHTKRRKPSPNAYEKMPKPKGR
ncbi:phosphatase inhibitor-domain-containing protein [Aspergillus floccosus]